MSPLAVVSGRRAPVFALLCTIVLAAVILAVFADTGLQMLGVWRTSETFAHGFVVPLISLYLLWRERAHILAAGFRPTVWGLLGMLLCGLAWWLGELAAVAALSQFALAGMLIAAVWAVWGHRATWAAAFPLGFLLFAVPFGDFLLPWMMGHTADFTVAAVRASGIPVYREGLSFVIPSGRWSVVEACSGIRYLIASVMVGALFAWLNYQSFKRRALFVLASFIVPILANWLRAYLIVMLGHLSNNQLAVGVDHLIYGWLFFGIVIFALFWLGAKWREPDRAAPASEALRNAQHASPRRIAVFALLAVACAVPWHGLVAAFNTPVPAQLNLQAPLAQGGWQGDDSDSVNGAWLPLYSGYRAAQQASYTKDGVRLTLWMAYYAGQQRGFELVQWDNRILDSEDKVWSLRGEQGTAVDVGSASMPMVLSRLQGPRAIDVWHWLWLGQDGQGRPELTISQRLAKLSLLKRRVLRQPDDSAALFVMVERRGEDQSTRAIVADFLASHAEAIHASLGSARR